MEQEQQHIATNFRQIREYLSNFAEDNEALEHYLCLAMTDLLARRQNCLRPAQASEAFFGSDNMLKSLSEGMPGKEYGKRTRALPEPEPLENEPSGYSDPMP